MNRYNPLKIEEKWQKIWEDTNAFAAKSPKTDKFSPNSAKIQLKTSQNQPDAIQNQPKMYLAEMFPYPSGAGLHVGHVRNFSIVDALTRFYTQQEMNVLRPFGYDTFGLPAENYAIKTGTSPKESTKTNITNFKKQLKKLGFAIDWSREINTSDPEYYRWTQWCFGKLYEKGLAYQKESYQWWCPHDKTVLANEQVEGGKCWRCGTEVEKKKMKQWFFKITAYADELLDEIDALDWPEKIKTMQKNWIGRSKGANITFSVKNEDLTVFTTRPDTIFGATFLVLAPEHPLVDKLTHDNIREKVEKYCADALKKSEIERQENKEKTGVFLGVYAKNPLNNENLPIWVSDYVLMGYGEGAIMAVPAHDERDYAFAKKYDLPIKKVIEKPESSKDDDLCYNGEGELINSGEYNGLSSHDAREQIVKKLHELGKGDEKVTYRMRDWLISRQRYWGCPIPIAYDKNGNAHLIPEDQLPVVLPEITDYQPDDSGRSALAKAKDWLKVTINGEEMTRETDTLDGYACSSWYLWRYTSPHDKNHAWDPESIKYWAPTDVYVGGDHAVAHLLYVRFWCKFFADLGLLPFREPVKKLLYNGYINAPDGKKMSKSKGNVIDPLDVIDSGYGADTLRTYELFIGPYELDAAWDTKAIGGVYRFLNRCWTLCFEKLAKNAVNSTHENPENDQNAAVRHQTIKKVTTDLHRQSFNTAVATLMEYVNHLYKSTPSTEDVTVLAKLLKPFAPHLASEMLEHLEKDDIWPIWEEKYLKSATATVIVQINGKLRAKLEVSTTDLTDDDKLTTLAKSDQNVAKNLEGHTLIKTIIPQNRKIVNFVVK